MGWRGADPYAGQPPEATLGKTPLRRLCVWLGTGFGLGLVAPCAPGTFGSLPGVAVAVALSVALPQAWAQALVCAALAALAVPICAVAEDCLKKKDDGRISADEWMLYPIATIGLPLAETPWLIALTFVVIRALDVLKPPPARQLQFLPGGWGIVADDFFAQLYALAVNWGLFLWLWR